MSEQLIMPPSPPPARPDSAAMLRVATVGKIGLVQLSIPERPFPVWLRAGTNDAAECAKSLARYPGGLRVPYEARRILEIGAGAGYRSVALAKAFPDAEIIAAEADPALRKVNLLNTLPYRNITSIPAPVGRQAGTFAFTGRRAGAGEVALAPDPNGSLTALPLAQLLTRHNWDLYDTVIITPDAASENLLTAEWPDCVRLVAIRTNGKTLPPAVAACLKEEQFLARTEEDYVLMFRREVSAKLPPRPRVPIFDPAGTPCSMAFDNVSPMSWGFFSIGAHGFRLHPTMGNKPSRLTVFRQNLGFARFQCRLRLGRGESHPVRFSISISDDAGAEEYFRQDVTLRGGEIQDVVADLPPAPGPCRVAFGTVMAEPGASHNNAWAEFLDPVFL